MKYIIILLILLLSFVTVSASEVYFPVEDEIYCGPCGETYHQISTAHFVSGADTQEDKFTCPGNGFYPSDDMCMLRLGGISINNNELMFDTGYVRLCSDYGCESKTFTYSSFNEIYVPSGETIYFGHSNGYRSVSFSYPSGIKGAGTSDDPWETGGYCLFSKNEGLLIEESTCDVSKIPSLVWMDVDKVDSNLNLLARKDTPANAYLSNNNIVPSDNINTIKGRDYYVTEYAGEPNYCDIVKGLDGESYVLVDKCHGDLEYFEEGFIGKTFTAIENTFKGWFT